MKIGTAVFRLLLSLVLVAVFFRDLRAQEPGRTNPASSKSSPSGASTGTLAGTVYDPSGRVVADARVSLLASLGLLAEHLTDSRGQYRFDGLRTGSFKLAANHAGFSTVSAEAHVHEGESLTVDLRMGISAVREEVVVSASLGGALAPQLGSSASVITQEDIRERGAQSVFEVLRGVPGVQVSQTSRYGGQTSLLFAAATPTTTSY